MSAVTGFIAGSALAFTPIEVDGLFIDGFAGGGGAITARPRGGAAPSDSI